MVKLKNESHSDLRQRSFGALDMSFWFISQFSSDAVERNRLDPFESDKGQIGFPVSLREGEGKRLALSGGTSGRRPEINRPPLHALLKEILQRFALDME